MKTIPLVFVALIALAVPVRSQVQEEDTTTPGVTPAALPVTVRIVGSISDGTPPLPQPPKPAFVVPAKDILTTTTREQGGRTITIQQIKPIALPPPPMAAAPVDINNPALQERIAAFRANHPHSHNVFMGATVYRSTGSPPRTLVHYWPEGGGEAIQFWSSADFALISGIHSFVATNGETHSLMLMWTSQDTTRMAEQLAAHGRVYRGPDIPVFPDGPATCAFVGTAPAAEFLVPIQSLHDLYNSEYERLKTAWEGRERARIEREAWLMANPPQPKNITLNYWRTEKPALTKGGDK